MLHINGITINPVERTIAYKGMTAQFSASIMRNIGFDIACRLIIGGPANVVDLWEMLYGKLEDGGPDYGDDCVYVHLAHLKHKITPIGLRFHREQCRKYGCYVQRWIAP